MMFSNEVSIVEIMPGGEEESKRREISRPDQGFGCPNHVCFLDWVPEDQQLRLEAEMQQRKNSTLLTR